MILAEDWRGLKPEPKPCPKNSCRLTDSRDPCEARRVSGGVRSLLAVAALWLSPALVQAQAEDPLRFQSVSIWSGTISVNGSGGGQVPGLEWTVNQTLSGTFHLERDVIFALPILQWFAINSPGVMVSVDDSMTAPCPPGSARSTERTTFRGAGAAINSQASVAMDFQNMNQPTYQVLAGAYAADVRVTIDKCDGSTVTNTLALYPVSPRGAINGNVDNISRPLPAQGMTLAGSAQWSLRGVPPTDSDWQVSWSLVPGDCRADVPVFLRQGDPAWGKDIYDHDVSVTIAGKGCAMTSMTMAMIAAGYGGNLPAATAPNPGAVNAYMTQKTGFFKNYNGRNVMWDAAVRDMSFGTLQFDDLGGRRDTLTDPNGARRLLDEALCAAEPHPVIVGVKLDAEGNPGHFVVVNGKSGSNYTIVDPATGTQRSLSDYGNQFSTRGIVSGSLSNFAKQFSTRGMVTAPPGDISQLGVGVDLNATVTLIDPHGNITGIDSVGSVRQEIANSAFFRDRLDDDVTEQAGAVEGAYLQVRFPEAGFYRLVVKGEALGPFSVTIRGFKKDGSPQETVPINGFARRQSSHTYLLAYDPDASQIEVQPLNATGDYDGDGKSDVGIYRNGTWVVIGSSNGSFLVDTLGSSTETPVPADYDGDGKTDIAVYSATTGLWRIKRSSDGVTTTLGHGGGSFIPVPGDYDGDGKADIAVYANGVWSIKRSSDGTTQVVAHGGPGWTPVQADYDGDGKTDVAVYINGAWSILQSSNSTIRVVGHGGPTWTPVPEDYDGDGKADIAAYTAGAWSILRSGDSGNTVLGHGGPTWVPVPADYDGDTKADIAVYNSLGAWSIVKSANSSIQVVGHGGGLSDVPLN